MDQDKLNNLTSPCGLDCFNCEVYIDNVTDEMREMFNRKYGMPPEKVECRGCREQKGVRLVFPPCETYRCAEERGVQFCHECGEFPCNRLMPTADGADRFPHNIKLYNLVRMKSVGLDKWARETLEIRRLYFKGKLVVGSGPVSEEE